MKRIGVKKGARGSRIAEMSRTALLCAVLCVLSVITFPVGTIPVTLGTLGLFLAGFLLSPRQALFCVLGYLLLGAVGLPVFSSMQGGIGVLLGVTGGYLWCYPIPAVLPSLILHSKGTSFFRGRRFAAVLGAVLGLSVCYAVGAAWLSFVTGLSVSAALWSGVLPYIPFDAAKLAVAVLLAQRLPGGEKMK